MKKIFIKKTFVYSLIICFWILILGLFLFSSHIFSFDLVKQVRQQFSVSNLIQIKQTKMAEVDTGAPVSSSVLWFFILD